jgi:hypothetical protein
MNDLEEDLSRSLAATAATTETHVERLLDHALTTGARYRRRRRLFAGGGTALAAGLGVALVVGAVSLVPHSRSGAGGLQAGGPGQQPPATATQAPPSPGATVDPTAQTSRLPQLTLATGVPSVLQAPGQLGDPRYLHASIDPPAVSGTVIDWASVGDFERLAVSGSDNDTSFELIIATSTRNMDKLEGARSTITVSGHSAQYAFASSGGLSRALLRWQPASGVWAQLAGNWPAATAKHLAESIRFDRTYLCPAPFQLPNPPAHATRTTCTVSVVNGVANGTASIALGSWDVVIDTAGAQLDSTNTTLGGHPARVQETPGDGGHTILQINVDHGAGHLVNLVAEGHYDANVAKAIAGSVQPVTDPDPAHWPTSPLP